MLSLCNAMIAEENFENRTDRKFTVQWKAKDFFVKAKDFPCMLMREKLVDKEILCLPLNFPLAYHMHEGSLEDKGKVSLLHEQ